jgi:hypothetical protein
MIFKMFFTCAERKRIIRTPHVGRFGRKGAVGMYLVWACILALLDGIKLKVFCCIVNSES